MKMVPRLGERERERETLRVAKRSKDAQLGSRQHTSIICICLSVCPPLVGWWKTLNPIVAFDCFLEKNVTRLLSRFQLAVILKPRMMQMHGQTRAAKAEKERTAPTATASTTTSAGNKPSRAKRTKEGRKERKELQTGNPFAIHPQQ